MGKYSADEKVNVSPLSEEPRVLDPLIMDSVADLLILKPIHAISYIYDAILEYQITNETIEKKTVFD